MLYCWGCLLSGCQLHFGPIFLLEWNGCCMDFCWNKHKLINGLTVPCVVQQCLTVWPNFIQHPFQQKCWTKNEMKNGPTMSYYSNMHVTAFVIPVACVSYFQRECLKNQNTKELELNKVARNI